MKTRILIIAVALGGACATGQAADFPANRSVPDVRLDRIRGGFDFGDNLRASFALQRTVLINGMEAMRTTITVPDIANITRDQAAALQDALRTTVVTNGAGGVADAVPTASAQNPAATAVAAATPATSNAAAATLATVSAVLPNSALPGLVVQNSLDNQAITATTTIDASVNSARMLESIRMAESVNDAVIKFRGN
ncbi:hypothetical protein [Luteibacter yeojuensis]